MNNQGLSAFQDFPGENLQSVCRQPRMASKGPSASASPENSSAGGPSGSSNGAGESGGQDSTFECNICLDTAKDAVISLCGHLFWSVPLPPPTEDTWPCLENLWFGQLWNRRFPTHFGPPDTIRSKKQKPWVLIPVLLLIS